MNLSPSDKAEAEKFKAPSEHQVVTALGVIEHCSDDDLLMLAIEAMAQAVKRGNSFEVFSNLKDNYEDAFSKWELHFDTYRD